LLEYGRPQLPGQATNVSASISPLGGYVTLNFTKASDADYPVTAYLVISSPHDVPDQEIDGRFDHGLISGVPYGEVHTFTLTAISAAGAGSASDSSTMVGDTSIPTTPDGVGAIPARTSVQIVWNREPNVNGYTIYRDGIAVGSVPGPQLYFFDQGLSPGATYRYAVDAYNLAGYSPASEPISITTNP
jgi:hypothetical protein